MIAAVAACGADPAAAEVASMAEFLASHQIDAPRAKETHSWPKNNFDPKQHQTLKQRQTL